MENIFSDVFKKLFDNPFADKGEEQKPVDTKKVDDSITKMLNSWGDNTKKRRKAVNTDDTKKVEKEVKKGGLIELNPISKRFTDDDVKDKNRTLHLNEYDGKNTVEIESTAISKPILYDEETGECWLRFKDKDGKPGKKWYHYIGLDENELLSFSKASSKGRFVNLIMKYKNHDPAYGPTPTKK